MNNKCLSSLEGWGSLEVGSVLPVLVLVQLKPARSSMVVLPGTQLSLLASSGAIDRLGSYGSAGPPTPLVGLEVVVFLVLEGWG